MSWQISGARFQPPYKNLPRPAVSRLPQTVAMALSYWSYLWDGSTGITSKYGRTKKSAWRNLINLWRTRGWAVIFADFDPPLRLIHFGEKALLPGITGIAHRQARSLCSARAAKFR